MQVLPRFVRLLLHAVLSREAYARASRDLADLAERVTGARGARAARRACTREAGFILLWTAVDLLRRAIERLTRQNPIPMARSRAMNDYAAPISSHRTRSTRMEYLGRDLRYGARALRRSPGFTAVALLTLALGIGATTTLFSVVDRVLLRPAPWPDADRIAVIGWDWGDGYPSWSLTPAKADYWRRHGRSFEAFAIAEGTHLVLTDGGEPARLTAERVSTDYFRVIGMAPAIGRAFAPEEDEPGGPPVVILNDGLWRRGFGADPRVIGREITLDRQSHTVIGVMPPAFDRGTSIAHPAARPWLESDARGAGGIDLLVPLRLDVDPRVEAHDYLSFGRLAAGVTADRIEAEAAELTRQFGRAYPGMIEAGSAFRFETYTNYVVDTIVGGTVRSTVWLLFGAVGLLLLIACANVASLLLARAETRRQELAVRAALGAGRGRLIGQLVAEGLMLGLLGGALGSVLAGWGIDVILALSPARVPGLDHHIELSLPVLGFAFATSVLTGVGVGLAGSVHALRADLASTLRDAGRSVALGHRAGRNARGLIITLETSVSVVLLVGAGLLLASLLRLREVDLGFEPERAYAVELRLPPERYATTDATWRFEREVIERLHALPGITAVASASNLPLVRGLNIHVNVLEAGEPQDDARPRTIEYRAVSAAFLGVIGTAIIEGRGFSETDVAGAPPVALVNETFVRRFLAGDDPLGTMLSAGYSSVDPTAPALFDAERTVVGVVRDVKDFGPRGSARPTVYAPRSQVGDALTRRMNEVFAPAFVMRAANPTALEAGIRRVVHEVDPDQPILRIRPLTDVVAAAIANDRFFLRLLGTFATLALVLTAVGVYGVVSYAVGQRTHEIGLRMALGAGRRGVLGLVIRQGMASVVVGLAIGLVAAYALSRLLAGLLFEVAATDPTTFAGVALLLATVSVIACYIPARRASRLDPMIALRAE
ncbi:MAG: ABC transporter permease [Longimicrobiales bacterium]